MNLLETALIQQGPSDVSSAATQNLVLLSLLPIPAEMSCIICQCTELLAFGCVSGVESLSLREQLFRACMLGLVRWG